jgi:hypothetical protein
VFILKEVKVVSFDTLLEVLIPKELEARGLKLEAGRFGGVGAWRID